MPTALVAEPESAVVAPAAPGRRHLTCVLVGCLLLVVAWSGSGLGPWPLALTLLSACLLLGTGAVWLVQVVRTFIKRRRLDVRFVAAPTAVLVTAALLHWNVPGVVRFRLTEGAFDQAVHQDGGAFVGHWLGSYRIDETRTIGDGTFFLDHDGSTFDYAGFAYLPSGPSPGIDSGAFESPQFRHLYGHWYTFAASW